MASRPSPLFPQSHAHSRCSAFPKWIHNCSFGFLDYVSTFYLNLFPLTSWHSIWMTPVPPLPFLGALTEATRGWHDNTHLSGSTEKSFLIQQNGRGYSATHVHGEKREVVSPRGKACDCHPTDATNTTPETRNLTSLDSVFSPIAWNTILIFAHRFWLYEV